MPHYPIRGFKSIQNFLTVFFESWPLLQIPKAGEGAKYKCAWSNQKSPVHLPGSSPSSGEAFAMGRYGDSSDMRFLSL
jgi:hypothetical protein